MMPNLSTLIHVLLQSEILSMKLMLIAGGGTKMILKSSHSNWVPRKLLEVPWECCQQFLKNLDVQFPYS